VVLLLIPLIISQKNNNSSNSSQKRVPQGEKIRKQAIRIREAKIDRHSRVKG
jgi:hypothetical protein